MSCYGWIQGSDQASLIADFHLCWMAILSNTKYDVGPGPGLITITTTTIVTSTIMSWAVAGLGWRGLAQSDQLRFSELSSSRGQAAALRRRASDGAFTFAHVTSH